MKKAGGNWVEGDDFFAREAELDALAERVRDGNHTLLTAQRRMGKTSLVRELLRRLKQEGKFEAIFVDLEAADGPADAVAEIASQVAAAEGGWHRISQLFKNALPREAEIGGRLAGAELRVKLRAGVDAGNWRHKGDQVFAALAGSGRAVLALDELPILVNRLLKGDGDAVTPQGKRAADEFLSWLRKNGQAHRGKVSLILSGSVSLEPILQQARLSAHANIFAPFDLKPWDENTATGCLGALAETYGIDLPQEARQEMCRLLRCPIPHHVQRFFDALHEDLRRAGRNAASLEDVERVYQSEMLGVRGQMDMDHYEGRLKMVLGGDGCRAALEMLKDAAVANGVLSGDAIARQRARLAAEAGSISIDDVLHALEHDGYLERRDGGYRFISGLLEDWWRIRYGGTRASAPRGAGAVGSIKP